MDLEYTFEKMSDGRFQVRLKGEYICYSKIKDVEFVDKTLKELGYKSKEDFLKHSWEDLYSE
jgi:hypothetical protein